MELVAAFGTLIVFNGGTVCYSGCGWALFSCVQVESSLAIFTVSGICVGLASNYRSGLYARSCQVKQVYASAASSGGIICFTISVGCTCHRVTCTD